MNHKLNSSDGFTLHGWMVTDLHLKGADLVAFALVHQFAQSHAGEYFGNTAYLSAWTGWTEKTSKTHLQNLTRMGLIVEVRGRQNNTPFCHYKLAPDFYEKHYVKFTQSPSKNFQDHSEKSSESTTKILRQENNSIEIKKDVKRFTPPSVDDVHAFASTLPIKDPLGFAYFYVGYFNDNNWTRKNGEPLTNWKNNIRNVWLKNNKDRDFSEYIPNAVTPSPKTTVNFAGL